MGPGLKDYRDDRGYGVGVRTSPTTYDNMVCRLVQRYEAQHGIRGRLGSSPYYRHNLARLITIE